MKTVVITGSTRGIGLALTRAFLMQGCAVVISGRNQGRVDEGVKKIKDDFPDGKITGFACDVTDFKQVEMLWQNSVKVFGAVDIWINNAGISNTQNFPWNIPADEIRAVVETNMLGEMFGSKVAISGFNSQGYGALYNLEGMGSSGRRRVSGLSIYGATKAGLRYFNDALADEIKSGRIVTGAIQPGMMLTDMIMEQYRERPEEWERVRGIFSIISEEPDIVAEWLVKKILANTQNGVRFSYGGMHRMASRWLKKLFKKQG